MALICLKRALLSSSATPRAAFYADLTFGTLPSWLSLSRASMAWMFDATGTLTYAPNNLLAYSNAPAAVLSVQNGAALTANAATDPAGGNAATQLTVTTAAQSAAFKAAAVPANTSVIFSVWIKSATGSAQTIWLYGYSTSYVVPQAFTATTAWTRVFIKIPAATITQYVFVGNYTSATAASIYFYGPSVAAVTYETVPRPGDQVYQTTAYQGPRFDYGPLGGLAAIGLLKEPASQNLFLNNMVPATQTITVASGTSYTVSFYGTGSIVLSGAATGTLTGTGATTLVQIAFTASATSLTATVTGLSTISYAQVEASPFATSRIITGAAPVTRSEDIINFTGAALTALKATNFTLAVEAKAEGLPTAAGRLWSIGDGSGNNSINAYFTVSTTMQPSMLITVAGSPAYPTLGAGGDITAAKRRLIVSAFPGKIIDAYDGGAAQTTLLTLPTGATNAQLGGYDFVDRPAAIWFSKIGIWTSALAGAPVQKYSAAGAAIPR